MKQILLTFALLIAPLLADAQPGPGGPGGPMPRGKWWTRPDVVARLRLAPEQQRRLDAIFRAASDALIDSKAAVQKLELDLQAELRRTEIRRGEIQRIATQLSAARARLFERELMMLVDMRGVLDARQWQRLQAEPPFARPQRRGPRR